MKGQKIGFPDCGTCDWPVEIIETIKPMQKVPENSCQSCKKSDNFLEKYTSRAISPIYIYVYKYIYLLYLQLLLLSSVM